jgi:hypothetical protein
VSGNAGTRLIREVETAMGKAGTKRAATVSGAVAAVVLTAALAGCARQVLVARTETVSTANTAAAAAVAAARASDCPGTRPRTLTSNAPGLAAQLEPIDATRVLLCVYASLSAQPGGPERSASPGASAEAVVTDVREINTLRDALNALAVPPARPVNCPNDNGSTVLGTFTNGRREVEVLMKTSGCLQATNGRKTGWVGASDFADVLAAVLKG